MSRDRLAYTVARLKARRGCRLGDVSAKALVGSPPPCDLNAGPHSTARHSGDPPECHRVLH